MSDFLQIINQKIKTKNNVAWSHEQSVDCAKYYLGGKNLESEELNEANNKITMKKQIKGFFSFA